MLSPLLDHKWYFERTIGSKFYMNIRGDGGWEEARREIKKMYEIYQPLLKPLLGHHGAYHSSLSTAIAAEPSAFLPVV